MSQVQPILINGEWIQSKAERTFKAVNPATKEEHHIEFPVRRARSASALPCTRRVAVAAAAVAVASSLSALASHHIRGGGSLVGSAWGGGGREGGERDAYLIGG